MANNGEVETYAGYARGDSCAYFYSAEPKWIRKMARWAKDYVDEVKITVKNDDGMEIAVPISWFKISPRRVCNLTDEQRKEISDRAKKV